jgi:hypothetical protein
VASSAQNEAYANELDPTGEYGFSGIHVALGGGIKKLKKEMEKDPLAFLKHMARAQAIMSDAGKSPVSGQHMAIWREGGRDGGR